MILLIDNYDSFSYNLVPAHRFGDQTRRSSVIRNDEYHEPTRYAAMAPSSASSSPPAPEEPADAGICEEVVQRAERRDPDPRCLPGPSGHL